MIIATITAIAILYGGGSIFSLGYIRDAAKEVIKDKDRAKQVVAITKQADKQFKSFNKHIHKVSKQIVQMNADYNLTREDIDSFYIQADKRRTAFLERSLELHFQAKNLMTAEEWWAMYAKIREEPSK